MPAGRSLGRVLLESAVSDDGRGISNLQAIPGTWSEEQYWGGGGVPFGWVNKHDDAVANMMNMECALRVGVCSTVGQLGLWNLLSL